MGIRLGNGEQAWEWGTRSKHLLNMPAKLAGAHFCPRQKKKSWTEREQAYSEKAPLPSPLLLSHSLSLSLSPTWHKAHKQSEQTGQARGSHYPVLARGAARRSSLPSPHAKIRHLISPTKPLAHGWTHTIAALGRCKIHAITLCLQTAYFQCTLQFSNTSLEQA